MAGVSAADSADAEAASEAAAEASLDNSSVLLLLVSGLGTGGAEFLLELPPEEEFDFWRCLTDCRTKSVVDPLLFLGAVEEESVSGEVDSDSESPLGLLGTCCERLFQRASRAQVDQLEDLVRNSAEGSVNPPPTPGEEGRWMSLLDPGPLLPPLDCWS